MRSADIAELLAGTEVFGGLPDGALRAVAARAVPRRYARGQLVWAEGEPATHLVVVAEGHLKVLVAGVDGSELVLTVVGPGALLGEVSLAGDARRSAAVVAVDAAVVLLVERGEVLRLVREVPDLAVHLVERLAAIVRRLTETTADLALLDLPRRLAKLLLERGGDGGAEATARTARSAPLNQSDLAQLVGSTRQSVNGVLMGWQRRGFVRVDGRTVEVRDGAALRRLAES